MLNDFLSKQPIDIIVGTIITDDRVIIPVDINSDEFHQEFTTEIESEDFTTEKAIYVATTIEKTPYKSSSDLLNSHLHFT